MFFLAGYGDRNFGPWFKPEIKVRFQKVPDTDYPYTFVIENWGLVLADEARVKILNSPKLELVGKEGLWGSFREELQCSNQDLHNKNWVKKKARISVEILNPLWRCVDFADRSTDPIGPIVRIAVELDRRREHIDWLKQQNKELQEKLAVLSGKFEPVRS